MIKVLPLEIRTKLKTLTFLRFSNKIKNSADLITFFFISIHSLKGFKIGFAEIHSFYTYILYTYMPIKQILYMYKKISKNKNSVKNPNQLFYGGYSPKPQ